jgi:hypothetical protein
MVAAISAPAAMRSAAIPDLVMIQTAEARKASIGIS